jgi:hypothetical protein
VSAVGREVEVRIGAASGQEELFRCPRRLRALRGGRLLALLMLVLVLVHFLLPFFTMRNLVLVIRKR